MLIRRAIPADIPEMLRLLRQVCNVHAAIRPDIFKQDGQKYTASELEAILSDGSRPIWCALEGDRFLGYCFCQWQEYRDSTVSTDRKELYIDDLCVDEGSRGTGVATALYRHVCREAKQRGCDIITLNVWCGNDPALGFYEKMGMKPRKITMEMPLEDQSC